MHKNRIDLKVNKIAKKSILSSFKDGLKSGKLIFLTISKLLVDTVRVNKIKFYLLKQTATTTKKELKVEQKNYKNIKGYILVRGLILF